MDPEQEADKPTQSMEEVIEDVYQDFVSQDRDLFLYSGPVRSYLVDEFIKRLPVSPRSSIGLILTTYGGIADDAYRMARALQRTYDHITLYICGPCKSAGTLVVLGSSEIVVDDFGELGPLDVQILKTDDIQVGSGLDVFQALDELSGQAFRIFERHMLDIKHKSLGAVTLGTASDIGAKLAIGLLSPIAAQINPDRLGEIRRAIQIATEYGTRLGAERRIIYHLIHNYPAHGFVIDREEAQDLFGEGVVRAPDPIEAVFFARLSNTLHEEREVAGNPLREPDPRGLIVQINPEDDEDLDGDDDGPDKENGDPSGKGGDAGPRSDPTASEGDKDEGPKSREGSPGKDASIAERAEEADR